MEDYGRHSERTYSVGKNPFDSLKLKLPHHLSSMQLSRAPKTVSDRESAIAA